MTDAPAAPRGKSPEPVRSAPAGSPKPATPPPAVVVAPAQQFTIIGRQGSETFWLEPSASSPQLIEKLSFKDATRAVYSRDGSLLVVVRQKDVVVVRTEGAFETVCTIERPGVSRVSISPLGTYVVTWERMNEAEEPNLLVWRIASPAEPAAKFSKKTPPNPDQWPAIRWTADEVLCARLVTDGVEFFDGLAMRKHSEHISIPGLTQFAFEPIPEPKAGAAAADPATKEIKYHVAVFVAERKGEMACVNIYQWPRVETDAFVSRRKFMQAQYCNLEWSPAGGVLVAQASTDMDPTGKSYYGQSAAYILFVRKPEINGTIPMKKEGGVHHISWSPKGDMFAVVHGFMPSMTTVFSVTPNTYTPKADLGPSPRNTCLFSPDSSCIYLAGFANLQGEMDFFLAKTFEKVGAAQAHTATTWSWSPDSNLVGVAICAPRRRVDNGYRIFDASGNLVFRTEVQELYEFFWRPDAVARFPQSKMAGRKAQPKQQQQSKEEQAPAAAPAPAPAAPAKYRHPNATGWSLSKDEPVGGVTIYGKQQQIQAREQQQAAQSKPRASPRSLPPGCVYVEEKPKRRQRQQQKPADGASS